LKTTANQTNLLELNAIGIRPQVDVIFQMVAADISAGWPDLRQNFYQQILFNQNRRGCGFSLFFHTFPQIPL